MSKTLEQKRIQKSINKMFEGVDDDYLKTILEVAYCGEDPSVLDEFEKQRQADIELIEKYTELIEKRELDEKPPELQKKTSNDNVITDGNN